MKRVFLAVDISENARLAVSEHIRDLRRQFSELRINWVRPENLHVTIKFYGEITEAGTEDVTRVAEEACQETGPFRVQLAGTGSFGNKVLYVSLEDGSQGLRSLYERINQGSQAIGFAAEDRNFRPHLTIARLKPDKALRSLINAHRSTPIPPIEFEISDAVLYQSRLAPGGSIYTPLKRFSFRAR